MKYFERTELFENTNGVKVINREPPHELEGYALDYSVYAEYEDTWYISTNGILRGLDKDFNGSLSKISEFGDIQGLDFFPRNGLKVTLSVYNKVEIRMEHLLKVKNLFSIIFDKNEKTIELFIAQGN